jgi:NAD+ synthase (glutamine-hydrolysing)
MPSRISSQHSIDDAKQLAENLGIEYQTRSIEELHQTADQNLADELQSGHPVAAENLQARLRGLIVMAVANSRGAMALATGNKSELAQGYCTLYGDMVGGYAPLGDLYKTEVYQLAALINKEQEIIPNNSIIKPPSAELAPDQKDEDTLPPYELLDAILKAYIEEGKTISQLQEAGFDEEIVDEVISRLINNEHKRWQMPPAPRVSSRAFGQGWRQPLASKRT